MESVDLRMILLAAFAALALVGVYRSWRRMSGMIAGVNAAFAPSRVFVVELQEAIRATQREAAENVLFDPTATNRSPEEAPDRISQAVRDRPTRTIADAVRLTYAIEWDRDGYLHVVSTQLLDQTSAASKKHAAASAAQNAALILTQQLEDAGLDLEDCDREKPAEFPRQTARRERSAADLLASTFMFRLSPAEHDALLAVDPPWPPGVPER